MEYSYQGYDFYFNDGEVEVTFNGEVVGKREIGCDTSEKDFIKWCEYYVENEAVVVD